MSATLGPFVRTKGMRGRAARIVLATAFRYSADARISRAMAHRRIYDPNMAAQAKGLRRTMTFAEVRLWKHGLRAKSMRGYAFHRQWPMFGYIADFYCNALRLVIEVDGPTHGTEEQVEHDRVRDAALAGQSIRVLRLSNDDIVHRLPETIDTITMVVEEIERSTH